MSIRNQPYLPLYVQDFLTDEKLAECSAAATGVYIRLMCLMHKSDEYGKILLKQKDKQTGEQIKNFACKVAKHFPYPVEVVEGGLSELVSEKVLLIEGDYLIQKRMVKDAAISELRAKAGSKGGKNSTTKKNDFARGFARGFAQAKGQANSETETETINDTDTVVIVGGEGGTTVEPIKPKRTRKPPEEKLPYRRNILLTPSEMLKLTECYGAETVEQAIDWLSYKKLLNNYKYDSDYRTLLKWDVEDCARQQRERNNKPIPHATHSATTTGSYSSKQAANEAFLQRGLSLFGAGRTEDSAA